MKKQLNNRIFLLLAVLAVLSVVAGTVYNFRNGWHQGLSIIVATLIVVFITSLNKWFKDKQFIKIKDLA